MAFTLPLRPGGALEVLPDAGRWRLHQGFEELGHLTASLEEGTSVTLAGERRWTVSGSVLPLAMALWDEADGAGAAWCQERALRRGARVQVAGAASDLVVRRPPLGPARISAQDGEVARLHEAGRGSSELRLRFALAERLDVASFAAGLVLVAAWRACVTLLPKPPGGGSAL